MNATLERFISNVNGCSFRKERCFQSAIIPLDGRCLEVELEQNRSAQESWSLGRSESG